MKTTKRLLSIALVLVTIALTAITGFAAYENTWVNTGNQRVDIVEVAKTQVGNTNSGHRYRSDNAAWCASFVSWCARQANIPLSVISDSGVASPAGEYMNIPEVLRDNHNPNPGDIVYFNWPSWINSNYPHDHVGIVEYVDPSDRSLHTIEGNSDNAVRRKTYYWNETTYWKSMSSVYSYGVPSYQNTQGTSLPSGLANFLNKKTSNGTVRQNVSASPVSCNASNGNLPSAASTLYTGASYYFNVQVSNNLYVKTAKLYIKDAGKSSYSCVSSETAGNYMRYTYSRYRVGSSAGTLYFYWKLTFTDGSTKTLSKKSVPVKAFSVSTPTGWSSSFRMKSGAYTNAYDGVNGSKVGRVYPGDVVTVKYIYTNGWMKLSCPWDGGYNKIVYVKTTEFKFRATKYINAYSGVNGDYVGRVYPNDLVTVKKLYSSGWMKCVCPWDGGYNKTIFVKVGEIY